jgi:hypothetical protein
VPGLRRAKWYTPPAEEVAVNVSPVATFFRVRFAPSTVAPEASVIVPVRPPVTIV